MLFNKEAFNNGLFNVGNSASSTLAGSVSMKFELSTGGLQAKRNLIGSSSMMFGSLVEFEALAYINQAEIGMMFIVSAEGGVLLYIAPLQTGMQYSLNGQINLSDNDSFELEGLSVAPGGTVIIDTDTLDIFINNIADVTSWVTGGQFFMLNPGDNEIVVTSNNPTQNLEVTIVWANRWY